MSLSGGDEPAATEAHAVEQVQTTSQSDMPPITGHDGSHDAASTSSHDPDLDNVDDAEDRGEDATAVETKDEDTQSAQAPDEDAIEAQSDVSRTNSLIMNSDKSQSLTNQADAAPAPHDHPSANPIQSAPESTPVPSLQAEYEPQAQEEAAPSTNNTHLPRPPAEAPTDTSDNPSSASNDAIDIQSLVDSITARATQNSTPRNGSLPPTSPASSLPPRPPMPHQPAQSYPHSEDLLMFQTGISQPSAMTPTATILPAPGTYPVGIPGVTADVKGNIPSAPPSSMNAQPDTPASIPQYEQSFDQQQRWDGFLQEERRYVSEAKWDRFPEGSRIFIGNLSSERVSKKEVFDIFSTYGRLAQISLKQAYGFVQYHTVGEGRAAMDNLQGIEIRGRKIHLEFSRTQKRDGDGDKRGGKGKRDGDRLDGGRGRRDDYRPGRQPSPRRGSHRQQNSYDNGHRGRGHYDGGFGGGRGRSRSPVYGARDANPYRRRSPSPYRRASEAELDIPRRYGVDIPDVQFLLLQEVARDFIGWVEHAFISQGLKVHVMFLNPQFPRDAVIQRQVMEGVHAVAELDFRAQQTGKVSLQVFDRSAGHNNVRYDQYQDLDPTIAAQLVARAKSQSQLQSPYGSGQFPPVQQYPPLAQPPYMPPAYPSQPYLNAGPGPMPANLDDATLHKILGTIHGQQGGPHGVIPGGPGGPPMDVNALLASMGGVHHAAPPNMPPQHGMGYAPAPTNGPQGANGGDSAHHVQNIMQQLARYRQ